ncbi:hypothetical protein P1S61_16305 [Streptomyces sp. ME08-AFT2]|nr:hypothetical protein [Streptomyces sp. ME08-AFT2]
MREPGLVGVAHRDAISGAKAGAGLGRAGHQGVDGERGRGVGVGQPVDGGPLVLAHPVQQAGAGEGAQQGVTQHVGSEGGAAGGFGFLLLQALSASSCFTRSRSASAPSSSWTTASASGS